MYRFLDKRFYHKQRWEFDLTEFACEHIGISRNYDTGQLKRRLQPAITELESVGFLEPLPAAQRFVKISRGQWRIVFLRKAAPQVDALSQESAALTKRLSDRGVTPSVAAELVKDYPAELIETQMEVLDRLQQMKERESIRNPAGYLVKSIREGYLPPQHLTRKKAEPKRAAQRIAASPAPAKDPVKEAVDAYLASLTKQELQALEAAALEHATEMLAQGYHRSKAAGGPTLTIYRRMLQEQEAKRVLFEKPGSTKSAA